jgi:phosphate transport system protein
MQRKAFDYEIRHAKDDILMLGSMVEEAIISSVGAIKRHDLQAAQQIIDNDLEINAKRYDIENQIITLVATQQPAAHDLRVLASILKITSELERIGDYAKGIATLCIRIGDRPTITHLSDLPQMAELAMSMLHRSLNAFVTENAEMAHKIPDEDDLVDNLYLQFYRIMMSFVLERQSYIEEVNYLLWAAHNLERAADRAVNICERTIFIVTGEITELSGHKPEESSVQ